MESKIEFIEIFPEVGDGYNAVLCVDAVTQREELSRSVWLCCSPYLCLSLSLVDFVSKRRADVGA